MTHPVTAANIRTPRTVFRFQQRALHTWVPKPKLLKVKWALHYTFRLWVRPVRLRWLSVEFKSTLKRRRVSWATWTILTLPPIKNEPANNGVYCQGWLSSNSLNLYWDYVRAITQLQFPLSVLHCGSLKKPQCPQISQRKWSISESEHFCWCTQPWLTKDKTRPLLSCPFARPHGGFASSMGSAGTTREQRNSSFCQGSMAEDTKPTAYFSRQTKQLIWSLG